MKIVLISIFCFSSWLSYVSTHLEVRIFFSILKSQAIIVKKEETITFTKTYMLVTYKHSQPFGSTNVFMNGDTQRFCGLCFKVQAMVHFPLGQLAHSLTIS